MKMGFFGFFEPKWRHSDPAVRNEAVQRAGFRKMELIALKTRDNDVFKVAITRLAGGNVKRAFYYSLIQQLAKIENAPHLSAENIRERRRIMVEAIDDPFLLEEMAVYFDPEAALKALDRLPNDFTRKVLIKTTSLVIRKAGVDQLLPELPELVQALGETTYLEIRDDLIQCLEERLNEAVRRKRWKAIRSAISRCGDPDLRKKLILLLPGSEISFKLLTDLLPLFKDHNGHPSKKAFKLFVPILAQMREGGWEIEEAPFKENCPSCSPYTSTLPGYLPAPRDYEAYGDVECLFCNATGKVDAVAITGRLNEKTGKLVVPA